MNWNEFRKDYHKKYGSTTMSNLSKSYQLYKAGKILPKTRKAKSAQLKSYKNTRKGNVTRGWKIWSPQPGLERHQLKEKCGNKAFLDPKFEKYPVMKSLQYTGNKCEYSCEGIQSAYNRSKQYHQKNIANKAYQLKLKYCN